MLNVMSYCLPTPEVNNSLYRIKNTNTNLLLAFKLTDLGMISRTARSLTEAKFNFVQPCKVAITSCIIKQGNLSEDLNFTGHSRVSVSLRCHHRNRKFEISAGPTEEKSQKSV